MVSSSTTTNTISASFVSKRSRSPDPQPQKKVVLRIKNQQDGGEDTFKIGANAHLKRLMAAYCDKKNLDMRAVRFLFDDKLLKKHQTPAQLMMEDNDLIDMVMEQGGGGPYSAA
ncbi:hypothetical protein AALP_AA8G240500 [Arabis alpina]|uniref:Ubiquitin-like domain-containing protein n=1 Tax=Arabis alpina TaxID=50452 RepID=A0A087G926_ARAAL|nr:hypothetical protein AALP_AA8G240500 [Arabis alpina]